MTREPITAVPHHLLGASSFETDAMPVRAPLPRHERTVALLMLGRIWRGGSDAICRIRNVSAGGMRIDTCLALEEGERVTVEARNAQRIEGRVAWTGFHSAGIAFAASVDSEALLLPPVGPSGARVATRSPRFKASVVAHFQSGSRLEKMRVIDISLGGCRVESNASFPRDLEGTLAIPGLMPLACAGRWTTGNRSGLTFVTRPDFAAFAQWLEAPDHRFAGTAVLAAPAAPTPPPAAHLAAFDLPQAMPFSRLRSC
ncbi:PilZ domain-containing protein [Alteriqipengyuania lutimaris]|uniref:PilZ domain-containing protein n=1 Tax=Alteriqipengyuania lutimaris TaxID=1538146 RepID=A0A395LVB1_9SPHN|nr:PilZ domain-containing protein [Alteriqipengyuania lutimaris]MBB3032494.1 hypothetical protein [Alteriqipengyuania lutimaris]RDS78370.1 PilZ domain-containing protein [Alteriqipengyuania lutimaris]